MGGLHTGAASRRRTAVATVAVESADTPIRFGSADEWRVLVTLAARPLARLAVPDPGRGAGPATFAASVLAACDDERRRALLAERLRERMGAPAPAHTPRSVSVVVCTRDRLDTLATLLAALAQLDPRPDEVVVVDNAPPAGRDCRAAALDAGAVYVREDAPGLNNARRAGVRASTGELIAFTDDDCAPPPHWLRALPELFEDGRVGAASGPAFPARLDTPSRLRFEEVSSFSRGLARRDFDWTTLSPVDATQTGAGANMVLRRSLVERLGEVFPAELDVGTPTRSGGDMYALYKVLSAGWRVVYDPRLFTYHLHRADPGALHDTLRGYGVGLSAVATKLLIEEREIAALRVWYWLVRQYLHTVRLGMLGRADRTEVRVAWDYLRGGWAGPRALRAARRAGRAPAPEPVAAAKPGPLASHGPPSSGPPAVSAVVVTHRGPEVAERCVAALAAQQPSATQIEVVLVDDSADGRAAFAAPEGVLMRRVATGGVGAAGARNAGARAASAALLLFLDDDLVPAAELVERHLQAHRDGGADTVVIGYSPPRPVRDTLAAQAAALWWEGHFRAKLEMAAPTFVEILSGNMSVTRELFERVGGFDPAFGRHRREDWEWGIRVLQAGARVRYEPGAVAEHRFDLDGRGRIAAARAEGRGDALLVERYPFAQAPLSFALNPLPGGLRGRVGLRLLIDERRRDRALALLDLLERLKARTSWARWFSVVQRAAYEQGFREGGGRAHVRPLAAPVASVELDSSDPLPRPELVAPLVTLAVRGEPVARALLPAEGQWTAGLADQLASCVPAAPLARVRMLDRSPSDGAAPLDDVTVILGPAATRSDRDAARALGAAGADVRVLDGGRHEHWAAVDRAVRDAERPIVALPLPGVAVGRAWLDDLRVGVEGERVAAVTGAGLAPGTRGRPLLLRSGRGRDGPYPVVGLPSQYLVVRRDAHRALGGFATGLGRLGHQAPVLEFLERARAAGWVVGYRNTAGLEPALESGRGLRAAEWLRWQARGALIARAARMRGGRWLLRYGVLPAAVRLARAARPSQPGRLHAAGTAVATTLGLLLGARRG